MNPARLHNFITEFGDEELHSVHNFWYSYANRKRLIDFAVDTGVRNKYPKYGYDVSKQVYYYINPNRRKVPVPNTSIKLDVERFGNNICRLQRNIMSQLIHGNTTLQEWYEDTARVMKMSYRAVVDVARGSPLDMSALEQQRWQEAMEFQIEKLDSLAQRIERGVRPLDGTLLNTVCQIGHTVNAIFENWKLWEAQMFGGKKQARRRLTQAEHCHTNELRDGCIELAREGWVPIEQMVAIGAAACYGNCRCRLEFR